ncbi:MAG: glycoside hydrolase family 3 N-terminal domain-containing protein [Candidatus Acidiferrum sp.]
MSGAINQQGWGLGVMAAYPEIEDVPAHASEKWLTGVLRSELGFEGVIALVHVVQYEKLGLQSSLPST